MVLKYGKEAVAVTMQGNKHPNRFSRKKKLNKWQNMKGVERVEQKFFISQISFFTISLSHTSGN